MNKQKRKDASLPDKIPNVQEKAIQCIKQEKYLFLPHCTERMRERDIVVRDVLHVVQTGYREMRKDVFKEHLGAWNYAIRGKSKDGEMELRVCVRFDLLEELLFVTTMDPNKHES